MELANLLTHACSIITTCSPQILAQKSFLNSNQEEVLRAIIRLSNNNTRIIYLFLPFVYRVPQRTFSISTAIKKLTMPSYLHLWCILPPNWKAQSYFSVSLSYSHALSTPLPTPLQHLFPKDTSYIVVP